MKASEFIKQLKKRHGAKLTVTNSKLRVQNIKKLPRYVQLAIAGHRDRLQTYLVDGVDEELLVREHDERLEEFGCFRIKVLETIEGNHLIEKYAWTHPDSDQVLDQILVGLLDPVEVAADARARDLRSRTMEWAARFPAIGRILGR